MWKYCLLPSNLDLDSCYVHNRLTPLKINVFSQKKPCWTLPIKLYFKNCCRKDNGTILSRITLLCYYWHRQEIYQWLINSSARCNYQSCWPGDVNRIWLSIESIKLNRNQSNWLVESIELNRTDRSDNRTDPSDNRSQSNIYMFFFGWLISIDLEWFDKSVWLVSIEFD